jgi:hypothetical protein
MKKILVAVVLLLAFTTSAFATSLTGDVNTNTNTNTLVGTNTNVNTNANTNLNTNANVNTNLNTQGQMQGQQQGQVQGQGQKQTAVGKVTTKVENNTTIENPRDLMQTVIVPTVPIPIIQANIGDYTGAVPNFVNIKKLSSLDIVKLVDVHKYIVNFRCFLGYSKIYVENVENTVVELYNDSANKDKFRYKVIIENGSDSASFMLGGGSGITGNDGLTNGVATGGIGIAHSGARPTFIVFTYEVK